MPSFPEVRTSRYEGPASGRTLVFRHYNPDELVDGKAMREHCHNPKIFVSHSTKDNGLVRRIVRALRCRGIEPWCAEERIPPGHNWQEEISRALEQCEWFLVLMSSRSVESDSVRDEVDWAVENRWPGRFIPILLEDCDRGRLHLRLRRLQFIDFRRNWKHRLATLLDALG